MLISISHISIIDFTRFRVAERLGDIANLQRARRDSIAVLAGREVSV